MGGADGVCSTLAATTVQVQEVGVPTCRRQNAPGLDIPSYEAHPPTETSAQPLSTCWAVFLNGIHCVRLLSQPPVLCVHMVLVSPEPVRCAGRMCV